MRTFPLISAGVKKTTEKTLTVVNKYNNEAFATVYLASKEEILQCIQKAHATRRQMRETNPGQRAEILQNLHNLITDSFDEFADLICKEAGKPITAAKAEVNRCLYTLDEAIKEASLGSPDGTWREHATGDERHSLLIRRFPVGVASFITPFNFPLNLVMHKVAPAIVAGCPFVLKPSRKTPLCSLRLGELLLECGMPEGSFSVLTTAEYSPFVSDERIKVVSFTGGAKAGWGIKEQAVKQNVVLELGGNAACIVDREVNDLDEIADRICAGAFGYSGQSCISVQRVLVHESLYDSLCTKLVAGAQKFNEKQGDPASEDTKLGPLISEDEAKRIEEWVNEAVSSHNGKILCGGKRHGNIYDATFITEVDRDAKVCAREAFGPIATVHKFSDFNEAIEIANDSEFGLQVGVFTNNLGKSYYAYEVGFFILWHI
mmetsp:Transcript_5213/g.6345  ORF Transcript_5213/g.6345 Transcript_5213/m.6345 type:complete len:432 (-) Transcript_5213:214-1509(-)